MRSTILPFTVKKNFIIYDGKPPTNDDVFIVHPRGHKYALPYSKDGIVAAEKYSLPHPPLSEVTYRWDLQPLFASQVETARFLVRHNRCFVLSEMGTGKTRAVLTALDIVRSELVRLNKPFAALVLAPLSTLDVVWGDECRAWFAGRLVPVVLRGSSKQKLMKLDAAANYTNLVITNHDAVRTILQELNRYKFNVVVIDELAVFRNHRTTRWRALNILLNHPTRVAAGLTPDYVWGLTGTPMPNLPTDAWAQKQLLLPHANITKATLEMRTMIPVKRVKVTTSTRGSHYVVSDWSLRPDAHKFIYQYLQPAIRFRRSDVYELPDEVCTRRRVPETREQRHAISTLKQQARLVVADAVISVANAMIFVNKALQIYLGTVLDNTKKPVHFDIPERLNALRELIEQADSKVLVFASYRAVLHRLNDYISKFRSTAIVHGDVRQEDRTNIFRDFQSRPDPHVIIAHPKTMGHGVTLTAANTIIWYGPVWSAELYHQANARIARASQTSKRVIVHLYCSELEDRIFNLLAHRLDAQSVVLELFEKYLLT